MERNEQGEVIVAGTMLQGEPFVNAVEFAAKLEEFRRHFKAGAVKKSVGYALRSAREKGDMAAVCDAEWQSGWAAGYEDGVTAAVDLLDSFVRWLRDEAAKGGQHES